MKREDIEKLHIGSEARMVSPDFNIRIEKREAENGEEMDGPKFIEGIGSVMEVWTNDVLMITDNGLTRFDEKINLGAFDEADMSDVVSCFNHDMNMLLSRTTGASDDMKITIDNDKLRYSYAVKNECAEKVSENIMLKFVKGSSYLYKVLEDKWYQVEGKWKREILKIEKVFEMGPVVFPQYTDASVGARSNFSNYIETIKPTETTQEYILKLKLNRNENK
jgi:HK97 family phage prohead protease